MVDWKYRGDKMDRYRIIGMIAAITAAGCAKAVPPKPTPTPPPPVVNSTLLVKPTPPNSSAPNLVIPMAGVDGRRMTPNVDLSPEQSLWQMRIALNVAALNCTGAGENALIASYTRFLNAHGKAVAAAEKWVIASLGRRTGTSGVSARDTLSTRMYNYFAQPPVLRDFCAKAQVIAPQAAAVTSAQLHSYAQSTLPELDRPFVEFYDRYARYQRDYAAWAAQEASFGRNVSPNGFPVQTPTPTTTPPKPGQR